MNELQIVGWTNFESEYPTRSVEGSILKDIVKLIKDECLENGYVFSGQDHQNALTGVPVFSDGTCLRASMRAWGQIMAAIYSSVLETNLSYMDFYIDSYTETVLPEFKTIKVKPGCLINEPVGMILQEDADLISSSIQMGMPLMTLDKVINSYVDILKKACEK